MFFCLQGLLGQQFFGVANHGKRKKQKGFFISFFGVKKHQKNRYSLNFEHVTFFGPLNPYPYYMMVSLSLKHALKLLKHTPGGSYFKISYSTPFKIIQVNLLMKLNILLLLMQDFIKFRGQTP